MNLNSKKSKPLTPGNTICTTYEALGKCSDTPGDHCVDFQTLREELWKSGSMESRAFTQTQVLGVGAQYESGILGAALCRVKQNPENRARSQVTLETEGWP